MLKIQLFSNFTFKCLRIMIKNENARGRLTQTSKFDDKYKFTLTGPFGNNWPN